MDHAAHLAPKLGFFRSWSCALELSWVLCVCVCQAASHTLTDAHAASLTDAHAASWGECSALLRAPSQFSIPATILLPFFKGLHALFDDGRPIAAPATQPHPHSRMRACVHGGWGLGVS